MSLFPKSRPPSPARPHSSQPPPSADFQPPSASLSLDLPPLSLLSQPRPPFLSASSLSLSPTPRLSQPPFSGLLSLPLPDSARTGPAPAARTVLTVVVVTDFPPGALSLRHLARLPSLPSVRRSVRPPARGSAQRPTQGGRGRASSPFRPPLPGSPIAAQPGHCSSQSACSGTGPELGRGQGQPGEAAQGPLGLYQGP